MRRSIADPIPIILFVLVPLSISWSQESDPGERVVPELRAHRINPHAPNIDGFLNDSVWLGKDIQCAREFTQRDPDEGEPATESTLVAVAYDHEALYVAFWCYDSKLDAIDRQLVRRDREAESDNVTVCIDAYHDHRTCHRFQVSAAGVQSDIRYYNDDWGDNSWDGVWESAVKPQPWGWSAELKIPYHCLRFEAKEAQTWGIEFTRWINRKDEYDKWAFVPSSESGFVSQFGHLTGLTSIQPANHLEVLPYVVSRAETEPKSIGNPDGRDLVGNTGFDLKYSLTSNLVLDATVNPDFGQVELDQPVLNLSAYETFFDEKRPFFLEGADLFSTDFMLFYSRRIGRSPQFGIDDPEFAYYSDFPDNTTILGASKITGKLSGKTSVALVTAVTEEELGEYAAETNVVFDSTWIGDSLAVDKVSADTVFRRGVVEPKALYTAMRIKQDILHNSSVGALLTLVGQDRVHPAVTGGVDWRIFTNNSNWMASGQTVFSRVNNQVTGYGLNASFDKTGGQHVRGEIGVTIKDPYLYINRLGFTSRSNARRVHGWVQYRTSDDWFVFRNTYNNFNAWSSWNYDDVNYELGGDFNTYAELTNFWTLSGGVSIQAEKYSDVETRGNGIWQWPVYPTFSWWLSITTDQRRKVSFNWNPGSGGDRGGMWWANYVGVEYRPRSNMEYELGINYARTFNATRWVDNFGDQSLFADLDKDQVSLFGSAGLVLNPNLSIQLSAQGLISGLDYDTYRFYEGGNEYSGPVEGYNYDYNYSALNSTLLLRWEYSPGSSLYLVWTRARPEKDDDVSNLDFNRDFKRLFSGNAQNLFLVKASYWLNI
jgi:hypothetical protein